MFVQKKVKTLLNVKGKSVLYIHTHKRLGIRYALMMRSAKSTALFCTDCFPSHANK